MLYLVGTLLKWLPATSAFCIYALVVWTQKLASNEYTESMGLRLLRLSYKNHDFCPAGTSSIAGFDEAKCHVGQAYVSRN